MQHSHDSGHLPLEGGQSSNHFCPSLSTGISTSDRLMIYYRGERELLNVLRKQRVQTKMDLEKYFPDIQGASIA